VHDAHRVGGKLGVQDRAGQFGFLCCVAETELAVAVGAEDVDVETARGRVIGDECGGI
jgi:hypothetical protein